MGLALGQGDLTGLGVGIPPAHGPEDADVLELAGEGGPGQGAHFTGADVQEAGDLLGLLAAEGADLRGFQEHGPGLVLESPEEEDGQKDRQGCEDIFSASRHRRTPFLHG